MRYLSGILGLLLIVGGIRVLFIFTRIRDIYAKIGAKDTSNKYFPYLLLLSGFLLLMYSVGERFNWSKNPYFQLLMVGIFSLIVALFLWNNS
jgi:drug/metabolite transporter (DMT)-like permease